MSRYKVRISLAGLVTLFVYVEAKQLRQKGHETVFADDVRIDLPGDIVRITKRRVRSSRSAVTLASAARAIVDYEERLAEAPKRKEVTTMRDLRQTPVRDLTPEQCGRLLVHHHGGSLTPERRNAYLLKKSREMWTAYFTAEKRAEILKWIEGEVAPKEDA